MLIGLVRHGETSWNVDKRIQGQTDIPLNENGINQAKLLASRLASEEKIWDYVLTSDLQRAALTGQIIAQELKVEMLPQEVRLRERFFGEVEGTTHEERMERWGERWKELELGAETIELMRSRGVQLLEDLYLRYPEANILCVSHGSFIAQLLLELFPQLDDMRIHNLSYSIIHRDEEGWHLMLHNCTKHLSTEDLQE